MDMSSVEGTAFVRRRLVAYVRMSTEQQDLSIGIQLTAIRAYADLHNLELVHVYEDAGKSGMDIAKRLGMKQLLRDVLADPRPFDVVLVYDVSRWGSLSKGKPWDDSKVSLLRTQSFTEQAVDAALLASSE